MNDAMRRGPPSLEEIKAQVEKPKKAVVTGGMPYANGPIHLGHLAGAHIPPDIYARWLRMLIGKDNVLFVFGTDDHGSTSELSALKAGKPVQEFIAEIHSQQKKSFEKYSISFDVYSGTSRPECFPIHKNIVQDMVRKLHKNGMLEKRVTQQWYDPKLDRFLQDRFVFGDCPNESCDNAKAYSEECDSCGKQYEASELKNPKSALSDAVPVLRDTTHWWLDLWKVSDPLREWIQSKKKVWRSGVYRQALNTVLPELRFSNTFESRYKEIKTQLPEHKSRYAPGKKIIAQFENKSDLLVAKGLLDAEAFDSEFVAEWAHRSISRDVAWGIPMPVDLDPDMKDKTFYVWPDSLIAPLAFTQVALKERGANPEDWVSFWKDPEARIFQFIGQDNIYFYTLMQGALWLGTQGNILRMPTAGELQFSDVEANFHLMIEGDKMSKSKGNFYTADQLIGEMGYTPDQVRYFLAILSLHEKNSNFEFSTFQDRNRFLAGPLNAAIEKPLSACLSKFGGRVPQGILNEKVKAETAKIVQKYIKSMERVEYSTLLFAIENYARLINSLFTQYKPHDDRHPLEERENALYSCFHVLKNLMIMLYPFVPETMEKVRESLKLEASVFSFEELGTSMAAGHVVGVQQSYFPAVAE